MLKKIWNKIKYVIKLKYIVRRHKISIFKLIYITVWTFGIIYVWYKLTLIGLLGFLNANSEETRLLWGILLSQFSLMWYMYLPKFWDFLVSNNESIDEKKDEDVII